MTEKEARTKWCPMTRIGMVQGVSVNRHPMDSSGDGSEGVKDETRCIASDCACWRMDPGANSKSGTPTSRGFCGLAAGRGS